MAKAEQDQEWRGFPSTRNHPHWPGAWPYGVNFAGERGATRVVAVQVGSGEDKYGISWVGPVELSNGTAASLDRWAEAAVYGTGGYVHLFPADGEDQTDWLLQWDAAEEEG